MGEHDPFALARVMPTAGQLFCDQEKSYSRHTEDGVETWVPDAITKPPHQLKKTTSRFHVK